MAPEVFANGKYNNKIDIWAIGLIFYQLLFSKSIFKADNDI